MSEENKLKSMAELIFGLAAIAFIIFGLYSCVAAFTGSGGGNSCVAKWRAWFSEVGSYPTLSDGRNATDVAFERCARGIEPF